MIDPRIEMVDLEPDGFGVVSRLASKHLGPRGAELHVMHRDGSIVRAVDTRRGVIASLRGRPIAADARGAEALRAETDVDRVILVDERTLPALAAPLAAAAEAPTQDEMLIRSRRAFLGSPGVVAFPEARAGGWERWSRHLRSLGDEYVAVIAGYDGPACAFTLLATIRDGLVSHVTSLTAILGTERPPPEEASTLVDAAGRAGPVRIAAIAGVEVFARALSMRSVEPLRTGALIAFGLPGTEGDA